MSTFSSSPSISTDVSNQAFNENGFYIEIGKYNGGLFLRNQVIEEDIQSHEDIDLKANCLYVFTHSSNHITAHVQVEKSLLLILYDRQYNIIGSQTAHPSMAGGAIRLILRCKALVCIPWDQQIAEVLKTDQCRARLSLTRCDVWTAEEIRKRGFDEYDGWPAADLVVRSSFEDLQDVIDSDEDEFYNCKRWLLSGMPKDDEGADDYDALLDVVHSELGWENQIDEGALAEDAWTDYSGTWSPELFEFGGWYTWVMPEEQQGPYPTEAIARLLSPQY